MDSFGKCARNLPGNLSASAAAQPMFRRPVSCRVGRCTARNGSVFLSFHWERWLGQTHTVRSELDRVAMIVADLPTSARAHLNHATALQDAGRVDEAGAAFSNALRLNPDSAKAHVGLASTLVGQGKLDEAHTHYEQALRMEPSNAEYHSGYAYLLEQLGHDDRAAAECEASIRLAPKSAQAHYGYGAFLEKHGKIDEAIAHYRE